MDIFHDQMLIKFVGTCVALCWRKCPKSFENIGHSSRFVTQKLQLAHVVRLQRLTRSAQKYCRASHTGDACRGRGRERERGISSELADMTCCELHLRCRRCCCCFWSSFSFLFALSLSLSLLSSLSSLSSLSLLALLSSSWSSSASSSLLLLLL